MWTFFDFIMKSSEQTKEPAAGHYSRWQADPGNHHISFAYPPRNTNMWLLWAWPGTGPGTSRHLNCCGWRWYFCCLLLFVGFVKHMNQTLTVMKFFVLIMLTILLCLRFLWKYGFFMDIYCTCMKKVKQNISNWHLVQTVS